MAEPSVLPCDGGAAHAAGSRGLGSGKAVQEARWARWGGVKVNLEDGALPARATPIDLVALDDALRALATIDERRSQVIELRFFGGLTVEETANVLNVSPDTVMRDARLAKVWLARKLAG